MPPVSLRSDRCPCLPDRTDSARPGLALCLSASTPGWSSSASDSAFEGLGSSFGEALEERMGAVGEGIQAIDVRVERARASVETALKELVRARRLDRRCDVSRVPWGLVAAVAVVAGLGVVDRCDFSARLCRFVDACAAAVVGGLVSKVTNCSETRLRRRLWSFRRPEPSLS